MSRPSEYSDDIAALLCTGLMDGHSLRKLCEAENMPSRSTVYRWMEEREGFATKCAHARVIQADALADDMADIEDRTLTGAIDAAAARAVLSSKQWRASKLAPKVYGDKLDLNHGGGVEFTRVVRQVIDPRE